MTVADSESGKFGTSAALVGILSELARSVMPILERYTASDIHEPAPSASPGSDLDDVVRLAAAAAARRSRLRDSDPGPDDGFATDGYMRSAVDACFARRAPFDAAFPADEQLPRRFSVTLSERILHGRPSVVTSINGVNIGDRLTDTIHFDAGSRYHDVFHLAHVACLGWSPVLRNLLGRKRVSDVEVCELEDATRAQVIEEAIVSQIFGYLRAHDYLAEVDAVAPNLLAAVQELCRGYEVEALPPGQWRQAIIAGSRAFRMLRDNCGGTIVVDMLAGTLEYVGAAASPTGDDR